MACFSSGYACRGLDFCRIGEKNEIEGAPWGAPETATIWYEGGQPDFES